MRNIIRHLTKSKAEKQAELISAYVDRALPARAQQQFEQALARDAELQAAVRQQQAIQTALRQLPRQRAPRSFALDPALYGRAPMAPAWQPFPILHAATALAMLLLVAVLAFDLGVVRPGSLGQPEMAMTQVEVESFAAEPAEEAAMAPAVAEEPTAEQLAIQGEEGEVIATVPGTASEEALMGAVESANDVEDQATATDSAGEAAPIQGALESEAEEDAENSLGMARILTETEATAVAVPTLESLPPPMPTAAVSPAATDTAAATDTTPAGIAAAPAATTGASSAADEDITPLPAAPPAPLLPSRTLFLAAEIFLGAAVLGLALAAWWARRRS